MEYLYLVILISFRLLTVQAQSLPERVLIPVGSGFEPVVSNNVALTLQVSVDPSNNTCGHPDSSVPSFSTEPARRCEWECERTFQSHDFLSYSFSITNFNDFGSFNSVNCSGSFPDVNNNFCSIKNFTFAAASLGVNIHYMRVRFNENSFNETSTKFR